MQFQPPTDQPHADQPWQPPSQDLPPREQWQQPAYPPRPDTYYSPQSQPLPPQPPPFQQHYQQVYQPQIIIQQPKKSRMGRVLGIGCGSLVLLFVLIAIIGVAGSHGSTATTPGAQTTTSTNQPTTVSQPTGHRLGETLTSGIWQVRFNSVKTNSGDQFSTPKAGDIYLVLDVSLKNTASTSQDMSSIIQFKLRDSTGQSENQQLTDIGSPPDGKARPGETLRGQVIYEAPKNMHTFTLEFQDLINSGDLVAWDFTLK